MIHDFTHFIIRLDPFHPFLTVAMWGATILNLGGIMLTRHTFSQTRKLQKKMIATIDLYQKTNAELELLIVDTKAAVGAGMVSPIRDDPTESSNDSPPKTVS